MPPRQHELSFSRTQKRFCFRRVITSPYSRLLFFLPRSTTFSSTMSKTRLPSFADVGLVVSVTSLPRLPQFRLSRGQPARFSLRPSPVHRASPAGPKPGEARFADSSPHGQNLRYDSAAIRNLTAPVAAAYALVSSKWYNMTFECASGAPTL